MSFASDTLKVGIPERTWLRLVVVGIYDTSKLILIRRTVPRTARARVKTILDFRSGKLDYHTVANTIVDGQHPGSTSKELILHRGLLLC